jgi:hypothetical protein
LPNDVLRGSGCPECCERYGDNDTIYIWRVTGALHDGKPVYKIGITSARLGEERIKHVAKKHKVGYEIIIFAKTRVPAMRIEERIKRIGENPGYTGDGATEFRAWSEMELQRALDIIDRVQSEVFSIQLSLF